MASASMQQAWGHAVAALGEIEQEALVDVEAELEAEAIEAKERQAAMRLRESLLARSNQEALFGRGGTSGNHIANNGLDEDSVGRLKKKRRKSLWFILRRVLARIRGAHREILLLPTDRFRLAWDSVSITLVIFIVFSLPYRIAFDSGTYMEDPAVLRTRVWSADLATAQFQFIYLVDFFIDIFFLTDIGLNFITAYTIDGENVTSKFEIAKHYGRTWLVLDLASSIPFDWFFFGITFSERSDVSQALLLLRIVKSIKLLRLLRIARLYRYLQRLQDHFAFLSSGVLRLLSVVCLMACFAHWNGCIQFLLATFEATTPLVEVMTEDGVRVNITAIVFHPDSWVARMEADGDLTGDNAWQWSFFTAISQMLAISIGLESPKRQVELWGYLASVLFGALLYGVFVASLTAFISESDASAKAYASKLDQVNSYMRHTNLPRSIRAKIRTYYDICYPSKRSFDEAKILAEVSKPLRQEISLHKCQAVLDAFLCHIDGPDAVILSGEISQRLERVVYVAGDYVIREGEDSEGVYFISSGSVSIYQGEEMLTTLGPNSILGEMALLHPEGRAVASVRVDSSLEGYHLSKESYTALESSYPQIRDYIESIARLRLKQRATAIKSPVAIGPDASVEKMFSELHLGESRHDQLRRELRAKREVRQVEAVRGGSSMHSRFDKRQVSEAAGSRFDRKQPSFVQKKPVKTAGLQSVKGGKGWGILRQNTMARAQNDSKSVLGLAGQAGSARGACSTNGEGRLSRAAV